MGPWNNWKELAGDLIGAASLFAILFVWMLYATASAPADAVEAYDAEYGSHYDP